MSIIRSDEEIGLYINLGVASIEFLYILYTETRNIYLNIFVDEILMVIIGFLSYYNFFKRHKLLRFVVLYLWYRGFNYRVNAYYNKTFVFYEHFRTFGYFSVGLLPFIREG